MINAVRKRARFNGTTELAILPDLAGLTYQQFKDAVLDERRWELALEGFRFYDLVRWGDALSVLGPLGYTNRARFYPIPQKAIDLSGGVLKQNPEW